jgi:hypothetical protein
MSSTVDVAGEGGGCCSCWKGLECGSWKAHRTEGNPFSHFLVMVRIQLRIRQMEEMPRMGYGGGCGLSARMADLFCQVRLF